MLELFSHFQKCEMKSSFILWAQLCSGNMAVQGSSPGIPPSTSTQSLWWGGTAVPGRLFQMLVVSSGGLLCVWWGAVRDLAVLTTVVRLALIPRNPEYTWCSLGTASTVSRTAGQLEEGGCLLIRGPLLRLKDKSLHLITGLCFSLVYRYSNDILQQWIFLRSNGLLTTWCCFLKCCALNVGVALSLKKCVIANAILGSALFCFLVVTQFWAALWYYDPLIESLLNFSLLPSPSENMQMQLSCKAI